MTRYFYLFFLLFSWSVFASLSSQSIEALVNQEKITKLDDLIERLTDKSLNEYVLLYNSASPQKATFKNPRVVSFIDKGRLILGFNNVHDQMDPYQTLDILEFNELTKSYEGMILKFDSKGVKKPFLDKDSSSCLNCHSGTMGIQPFRTSYVGGVFPGFYGSDGDLLSADEELKYDMFLKHFETQKRYKNLLKNAPAKVGDFGRVLNYRQFQGLAPLMLKNKDVERFGYALLASLQCIGKSAQLDKNLNGFLPLEVRSKFSESFEDKLTSISQFQSKNLKIKLVRRELLLNKNLDNLALRSDSSNIYPIASFSYLLSNIKNLPDSLKHELKIIQKAGDDGYGGVKNLTEELYPIVLKNKPTLLKIFNDYNKGRKNYLEEFSIPQAQLKLVCNLLKVESMQSLTNYKE